MKLVSYFINSILTCVLFLLMLAQWDNKIKNKVSLDYIPTHKLQVRILFSCIYMFILTYPTFNNNWKADLSWNRWNFHYYPDSRSSIWILSFKDCTYCMKWTQLATRTKKWKPYLCSLINLMRDKLGAYLNNSLDLKLSNAFGIVYFNVILQNQSYSFNKGSYKINFIFSIKKTQLAIDLTPYHTMAEEHE